MWFTGPINAAFRQRRHMTCARRTENFKIYDYYMLNRRCKTRATSHELLLAHDFLLFFPLPWAAIVSKAALCGSEKKWETRKSYFVPGGRSLWGYRDRTFRAVFQFKFSKHRSLHLWSRLYRRVTSRKITSSGSHVGYRITLALALWVLEQLQNKVFTKKIA